jgi:hypothetical protein
MWDWRGYWGAEFYCNAKGAFKGAFFVSGRVLTVPTPSRASPHPQWIAFSCGSGFAREGVPTKAV